jgi:hypothetical protein
VIRQRFLDRRLDAVVAGDVEVLEKNDGVIDIVNTTDYQQ